MNPIVKQKNRPPRADRIPESKYPSRLGLVALPAFETEVPYSRTGENALEQLKNRLLREALAETQVPNMLAPLRRAANDAASLAWLEPQPLLVFPELFLEKRRLAHDRGQQQQRIRNRTARLLEVFA